MEALANGAGFISGSGEIGQGVIAVVAGAPAMADKFLLHWPDAFNNVVRTGVMHVQLRFGGAVRVNEKLALAAMAGVGAKNGKADHDLVSGGSSRLRTKEQ